MSKPRLDAEQSHRGLMICQPNLGRSGDHHDLLEALYRELVVAQHERVADAGGECSCEPGDPCPMHRSHEVLVAAYRLLGGGDHG